jgi:anti-sigma factor RsiW
MTWTCEQTEARLSEYLDGLLEPAEHAAFDQHVNACERCTPLVASVSHVLGTLHTLEQAEPSPQLVNSILTMTLGPKSWRSAKRWWHGFQSPRFVYSAVSVAATLFIILNASGFSWRKPRLADLSPVTVYRKADSEAHLVYARGEKFVSDLRVVYEIQSRLREDNEMQTAPEQTVPQSVPNQKRDRTDGTNPLSPKQQNRATGIGHNLEILAAELPVLYGPMSERRMR